MARRGQNRKKAGFLTSTEAAKKLPQRVNEDILLELAKEGIIDQQPDGTFKESDIKILDGKLRRCDETVLAAVRKAMKSLQPA